MQRLKKEMNKKASKRMECVKKQEKMKEAKMKENNDKKKEEPRKEDKIGKSEE